MPFNQSSSLPLPIVSFVVPCFWFNQLYITDFIRYPPKGTTMETIGISPPSLLHAMAQDVLPAVA